MQIENIKIVHFIPGRVRLRSKDLQGNSELAQSVERALAGIPAVDHVEVNSLTGSILISYRPTEVNSKESIHALVNTVEALFPTLDIEKLLAWLKAKH
jgi:hypothetical protein